MSNNLLHCVIQGPDAVIKDVKHNKWWIISAWIIIISWMLISATIFFWAESDAQTANNAPPFSWFLSLYFTVVNCTTVGFGDIIPKTDIGHVLAIVNSLVGVLAFGLVVTIISMALQPSQPSESAVLSALVISLTRGRHSVDAPTEIKLGGVRIRIIIEQIADRD